MKFKQLSKEFVAWRDEIDQDHLLDTFDLALGFYAGRFRVWHGVEFSHDLACEFATTMRAREAALQDIIAAAERRLS